VQIPTEADHPFRLMAITYSDGSRSGIPIEADH
jgi:hypothetical protein